MKHIEKSEIPWNQARVHMGGMGFGLKLQPPTFCARSCLKPFEMLRNAPRSPSKTSMKLSGMPLGALKLPKGSGNVPKDLSEVLACLNLLVTLSITILHVHIMWQARKYCIPKEVSITKKKSGQTGKQPITLSMVGDAEHPRRYNYGYRGLIYRSAFWTSWNGSETHLKNTKHQTAPPFAHGHVWNP